MAYTGGVIESISLEKYNPELASSSESSKILEISLKHVLFRHKISTQKDLVAQGLDWILPNMKFVHKNSNRLHRASEYHLKSKTATQKVPIWFIICYSSDNTFIHLLLVATFKTNSSKCLPLSLNAVHKIKYVFCKAVEMTFG